jgi:hypothetical protein
MAACRLGRGTRVPIESPLARQLQRILYLAGGGETICRLSRRLALPPGPAGRKWTASAGDVRYLMSGIPPTAARQRTWRDFSLARSRTTYQTAMFEPLPHGPPLWFNALISGSALVQSVGDFP